MQLHAYFQKRIHPSRAFDFVTSDVRIGNFPVSSSTLSKHLSRQQTNKTVETKTLTEVKKSQKRAKIGKV